MSDIETMLAVYKDPISDKVKKFAEPLDECFSIDEFVYTYIDDNGFYFAVSNKPEPSEFYFHKHLYKTNVLIRHPDNFFNGPFFPPTKTNKKHIIGEKFGYYGNTEFLIFRKTSKGVHKFLFNSKKLDPALIINFYIKNLALLEIFCDRFLDEWQAYEGRSENFKINIAELIGPNFHKMETSKESSTSMKESFLKKIGEIPNKFRLPKSISNQEAQCFSLLAEGKTNKEIASEMQLSSRTIEHYIENLKIKANCRFKSELVKQFNYFKLLGKL